MDCVLKGVIRFLHKLCRLSVCNLSGHTVWAVGYQRKPIVLCCHPHILDKFWPSHVAVRETAFVSCRSAISDVVSVVTIELMVSHCGDHLVLQLIIALSTEVRRKASGQRIVCQAFHVIRRPDVSKDTLRYFRCQQSFHHAARLIAACRTIIPSPFIGIGLIVNSAMIHTIIENTITIGDFIRLIAAKLIINRRRLNSLGGIDNVFTYRRIVAFVLPIPGLLIEQRSQIEQPLAGFRVCGIIYLVIKPENTFEIVSPAGVAPIA